MNMAKCRKCGTEVAKHTKTCPSCGIGIPYRVRFYMWKIFKFYVVFSVVTGIAVSIAIGIGNSIDAELEQLYANLDDPAYIRCELEITDIESSIAMINGTPDASFVVRLTATNNGQSADMPINVSLSTSEGNFERNQSIYIESGDSRSLSYTFHEPSVNVTNLQARASCLP